MTTYKSEMIEFRAGRIVLTEAQWTANTNVYPEGIIAITSDGSNAGRTKVFDGTSYWSQLAYNSGGGGAVTSDDVSDESILADPPGRPLTETLDAISQTFSDITTAVSGLTQELGTIPKVYLAKCTQTGTDAPVATIIKNTLGVVPVWTYAGGGGAYNVTSAGAFPADKTEAVLSSCLADGDTITFTTAINGDSVVVLNATGADESTFTIHISVYP